jgi:hypothetical protein
VCTEDAKATTRLPISTKLILKERVKGRVADVELLRPSNNLPDASAIENTSKMNDLRRIFAIAPMMEWTDWAEKQSIIST